MGQRGFRKSRFGSGQAHAWASGRRNVTPHPGEMSSFGSTHARQPPGPRKGPQQADGQVKRRRRTTRQGGSPEGAPNPERDVRGGDGGVTKGRLPGASTSTPEDLLTRVMAKTGGKRELLRSQVGVGTASWLALGARSCQRGTARRLRRAMRYRPTAANIVPRFTHRGGTTCSLQGTVRQRLAPDQLLVLTVLVAWPALDICRLAAGRKPRFGKLARVLCSIRA